MNSTEKSPTEIGFSLGYQQAQLDILRHLVFEKDAYLSAKDIELIHEVLNLNPQAAPKSEPTYPVSFGSTIYPPPGFKPPDVSVDELPL